MIDVIWVVNSGSSSIKSSLYRAAASEDRDQPVHYIEITGIGHRVHLRAQNERGTVIFDKPIAEKGNHEQALTALLDWIAEHTEAFRFAAAGHRVVHGGTHFAAPVLITPDIVAALKALTPLAPLHQPFNLAAVDAIASRFPGLAQVACFDTAFHQTQPAIATTFALPRALTAKGVRRYGFHGLSYEYIASVLPEHLGAAAEGRVVVAHLGHGASMCAMHGRRSLATTMGFSALDGLVMGRRCGSIDPGVILYLLQEEAMDAKAISHLLYEQSGLVGVSGISDDMRKLLASPSPHAAEAVDLFVYRIGQELGSLTAALGGLDALVFTAGIGEHAPQIRKRVCECAAWLGAKIDPDANSVGGPCISSKESAISLWMIPTDEDLMIARHTRGLMPVAARR
jgi:acetate kinase